MSSQNTFPGPNGGRAPLRPTTPASARQPAWVNPQAPAQQGAAWPPQQQPAGYPNGYGQQQPGYGAQPAPQQPDYGQWGQLQTGAPAAQADPYAPQFEPYVPPSRPTYGQPQQPAPGAGGQAGSASWPQQGRGAGAGGYETGSSYASPAYAPQPAHGGYHEGDLSSSDWAGPTPGGFGQDYQHAHGGGDLGFAQAEGGELDPAYEDDGEYEDEEPPRGRRPLVILAALVGAILVGGGMAYGYKKFAAGGGADGDPPIIKSEDFPAKTRPVDAGGKQFPYTDSKIMGRLGDGTSSASAEEASSGGQDSSSGDSSTDSASDAGGARKVATLVVGRDGTIQAPPAAAAEAPSGPTAVSVPGTSVDDVFGSGSGARPSGDAPAQVKLKSTSDDAVAAAKKAAPVTVTKVNSASAKTAPGSADDASDDATQAPAKKKLKKVARADTGVADDAAPAPPITGPSTGGGSGYVAVLASVPASTSSRMDALKRFADMQQKYGTALAGKTPDVAEANLGAKGNYHRLIVGPPGSREEASNVCSQLKSQGYNDCWVTTY